MTEVVELAEFRITPGNLFKSAAHDGKMELQPGLDAKEDDNAARFYGWYLTAVKGVPQTEGVSIIKVVDRDINYEIYARSANSDVTMVFHVDNDTILQVATDVRTSNSPSDLGPHAARVPVTPAKVVTAEHQLLLDAIRTVMGERQDQYGDPEDSLQVIADYWNAYLKSKGHYDIEISSADAGMMMILLKVGREANSPKYDNLVDIAGYAACTARALANKKAMNA